MCLFQNHKRAIRNNPQILWWLVAWKNYFLSTEQQRTLKNKNGNLHLLVGENLMLETRWGVKSPWEKHRKQNVVFTREGRHLYNQYTKIKHKQSKWINSNTVNMCILDMGVWADPLRTTNFAAVKAKGKTIKNNSRKVAQLAEKCAQNVKDQPYTAHTCLSVSSTIPPRVPQRAGLSSFTAFIQIMKCFTSDQACKLLIGSKVLCSYTKAWI